MSAPEIPLSSTELLVLIDDVSAVTSDGPLRAPLEGVGYGYAWVHASREDAALTLVETVPTAQLLDGYVVAGAVCEAKLGEDGPVVRSATIVGAHHANSPEDPKLYDQVYERTQPFLVSNSGAFGRLSALVRSVVAFNQGDAVRQ